jgi:acetyltransferase
MLLTEAESKQLLAAYSIATVETRIAATAEAAISAADEIGYPVVLKLHSHTVTHKTDVGGVKLNLRDAAAVRSAFASIETSVRDKLGGGHFLGVTVQPMVAHEGFELILGSSLDPQFGPVLLFGRGGQLVEIEKDRALALPPLNTTLARRMMEQTRIFKALRGVRGLPGVDVEELERLLVRFSNMIVDNPRIKEVDVNPLLASGDKLVALDARVVLHPATVADADLPRPVIRPYPVQYVGEWTMRDAVKVTIRPIRPEDEPLMIDFHHKLSDRSVYLRYFQPLKLTQRTAHERLTRICFIDYDREMALVTELKHPNASSEIIAVGRLSKLHGTSEAEVAVLVRDEFQHRGLGTELVSRLIKVAADERLTAISSTMLGINREMRAICNRLGFQLTVDMEEDLVNARAVVGRT